jgi:putative DNA primase/helicase
MSDNYQDVVQQMESFGVEWRKGDLPLRIGHPKRKGCGKGGKFWYRLSEFRPDAGGSYIVGRFGSYKSGESQRVEVDWKPLSDAERGRRKAEWEAGRAREAAVRAEDARIAALSAHELWATASKQGQSKYFERKQVRPEACRYLPDGSVVIPLLRYDWPRESALVATQRIYPGPRYHFRTGEELPQKIYTKGFEKPGVSLRLGRVVPGELILVAEGYATALTIRMATDHALPVFMALDAYNLPPVCALLADLYPDERLLICADDDWKTRNHDGELWNAGRVKAKEAAKPLARCDIVWPSFAGLKRGDKHTDFNDLHVLGGLDRVRVQLDSVFNAIRRHRSPAAA